MPVNMDNPLPMDNALPMNATYTPGGRTVVRAAIVSYLQSGITAGAIPSLSTVFAHPPKFTQQGDFQRGEDPGIQNGAVCYVHLLEQNERQLTIGPYPQSRKARYWHVGLICVLFSASVTTQEAGDANDTFIDGMVAWIEANRTANSDQIFQWGEGEMSPAGGLDIDVKAGMPKPLRQQGSIVFTTIDTTAMSIINA